MKSALIYSLPLIPSVLGAHPLDWCPPQSTFPSPERGGLDADIMACPIWSYARCGETPLYTSQSACLRAKSRPFGLPGAYTTVMLHQTEESWQQHPDRERVLSAVEEAVNAGLRLFGTHAGTPESPLQIHATVTQIHGTAASFFEETDSAVQFDGLPYDDGGYSSPCFLSAAFPPNVTETTLRLLQKGIVRSMYTCVEKYHRPYLSFGVYLGAPRWTLRSIARLFDGLAFAPTPAMLWRLIKYPEKYNMAISLPYQGEAAALFWHHLQNAGWTTQQITDRMKAMPNETDKGPHIPWNAQEELERSHLAADAELCSGFRSFGRALVEKSIRYPEENMDLSRLDKPFDSSEGGMPFRIEPGNIEPITIIGMGTMESWGVVANQIEIMDGLTLEFALAYDNDTGHVFKAPEWTFGNETAVLSDTEVSFRRLNKGVWTEWTTIGGGQWVREITPWKHGPSNRYVYQFVATNTGAYSHADFRIVARGICRRYAEGIEDCKEPVTA